MDFAIVIIIILMGIAFFKIRKASIESNSVDSLINSHPRKIMFLSMVAVGMIQLLTLIISEKEAKENNEKFIIEQRYNESIKEIDNLILETKMQKEKVISEIDYRLLAAKDSTLMQRRLQLREKLNSEIQNYSPSGTFSILIIFFMLYVVLSLMEGFTSIYGNSLMSKAFRTFVDKNEDGKRDPKVLMFLTGATLVLTSMFFTWFMILARLSTIPINQEYATSSILIDFSDLFLVDLFSTVSGRNNAVINLRGSDLLGCVAIASSQIFGFAIHLFQEEGND